MCLVMAWASSSLIFILLTGRASVNDKNDIWNWLQNVGQSLGPIRKHFSCLFMAWASSPVISTLLIGQASVNDKNDTWDWLQNIKCGVEYPANEEAFYVLGNGLGQFFFDFYPSYWLGQCK